MTTASNRNLVTALSQQQPEDGSPETAVTDPDHAIRSDKQLKERSLIGAKPRIKFVSPGPILKGDANHTSYIDRFRENQLAITHFTAKKWAHGHPA